MHQEIKANVIWLLLAFFLTFAGFWQAKVVVARDSQAKHRELPPAAKTKHAIRPPPQLFSGDVVADYVARCEKGMTDQEIGWILEDFRNAGLSLDWRNPEVTLEAVLHHRKSLDRWYHDALVDGLRLSPEQSAEVAKHLDELVEQLKHPYPAATGSTPKPAEDQPDHIESIDEDKREWLGDPSGSMIHFGSFPTATPYYPWKLCQLTSEQEKLTWKQLFLVFEGANHEELSEETAGLSGGPLFRQEDFYNGYPIDESLRLQSYMPNLIFPLLARQKLIANNDPDAPFSEPSDPPGLSALENVRLLHPCQLKVLLLFNPGFAPMLQSQLDQQSR
jgi:hypothetical protein